jgi:NAD(P)-dependent dehydrogenase (short-subunit alcohol dehydrogenase family)
MSLVSMIKGRRGASGFGYASTAEEVTAGLDLRGKRILVTGVASGLGQESARVLAMRGAKIFGAARSTARAAEACRGFGAGAVPLACDLADPDSVRACVEHVESLGEPLDAILCNAGIMALPQRELRCGQELQFFTNHIGHFLLVMGLVDQLTPTGRVVMLSSDAHTMAPKVGIQFDDLTFEKNYRPWTAYGQSKLANMLFARSLAERFAGTTRTANSLHPGVIQTELGRHLNVVVRLLFPVAAAIAMKSIPQGAATQCYVTTHPSLANVSGEYFFDCNVGKSSPNGRDMAMAARLWSVTEDIVERI